MAQGQIRVVVVDNHLSVREALRYLLNAQHDIDVVGEAGDAKTGIDVASALQPDVVVLDLSIPDVSKGLALTRQLRSLLPSARVVIWTRHQDRTYVRQLAAADVSGYVLKQSASMELLSAIRTVAEGGRHFDPLLEVDKEEVAPKKPGTRTGATERETSVLRLMSLGQSNKQIAADLGISVKTVEVHKANAMRKLNLSGRTDVVRYAAIQGWLQAP